MSTLPRIVLGAPSSGSGKSVIAMGLMSAFAARMRVQAFKVGPDYIDPMYHAVATGRPSLTLDTWMTGREAVLRTVAGVDADLAIVEGVMGLFDGAGGGPLDGTTAEVARLIGAPVVLVVDAARMAGSAAAVVHGFNTLVPGAGLAGVIANRVGSTRHGEQLRAALVPLGIPLLGIVPRTPALVVAERHLGLVTAADEPATAAEAVTRAREVVAAHVDLDQVLALAAAVPPLPAAPAAVDPGMPVSPVAIAVAQDEAFCFYYEDNLAALRRAGARIVPFSPLADRSLPAGVSGVYLGGGYPEIHAARLAANTGMLASLHRAARSGMPVYAECGGLMLLTEGIDGAAGERHDLAGIVPGRCAMGGRATLGYREVELVVGSWLGDPGRRLRGHEFHYSTWQRPDGVPPAYRVLPHGASGDPILEGYAAGGLLASYVHLHFAQDPALAHRFAAACRAWPGPASTVAPGSTGAILPPAAAAAGRRR